MTNWTRKRIACLALSLCVSGCTGATVKLPPVAQIPPPPTAQAQPAQKNVPQDPQLVITTAEVMAILAGPEAANYQLVDSRPEVKFQEGHVPGAISVPKATLEQNLDKLDKNKTIVFYCGGLHCELSPASAAIARKNGFDKVKVWYEGEPAWSKAGNYLITELPYVQKLVTGGKDPYLLVDSRPAVKYNKAFIPSAVSIPKAEFDLKKGLLPADKNTKLIFYCGGHACELSHESAKLALGLGYAKVAVFSAGEPAWKEAGLPLWGDEPSGVAPKPKADTGGLPETIKPDEFEKLTAEGKLFLVDVRSAKDFEAGHLPGAIHIFDEDFIHKAKESVAKLPAEGRVVLYCSTGARSASAYYAILGEADYGNKKNLQYLDNTILINPDGTFTIQK